MTRIIAGLALFTIVGGPIPSESWADIQMGPHSPKEVQSRADSRHSLQKPSARQGTGTLPLRKENPVPVGRTKFIHTDPLLDPHLELGHPTRNWGAPDGGALTFSWTFDVP